MGADDSVDKTVDICDSTPDHLKGEKGGDPIKDIEVSSFRLL